MEIVVLILKIIGIVLLALLGGILFLILSVVFIPVRYRIRGKGETPKEMESDLVFSGFLHLVHCRIRYGSEGWVYRLRILGIPINLNKEKKPKKSKRKRTGKTDSKEVSDFEELSDIEEESELEGKSENEDKTGFAEKVKSEEISRAEEISKTEELEDNSEIQQKGVKGRKTSQSGKHKQSHGIKGKFQNLKKKIIQLKERFSDIKNILSDETNRSAARSVFGEFKYLMKHYAPRKASGELQYGMEDPALTGEILGVISIFPFWYRYKISVIPDFSSESFYARGQLTMKGHIQSLHLLVSVIRLMKNKDIRKLINQIKQ